MTVSERIRDARKALGLSQSALAEKLGVGTMTVNRWEKGSTPDPQNVKPLAEVLGVNPLDLLPEGKS